MILIGMFLVAQLIGLFVVNSYYGSSIIIGNETANAVPYGMQPPEIDAGPGLSSIIFSFIIAIALILLLMRFKAATFLRLWFFFVVVIAVGVVINIILVKFYPSLGVSDVNLGFFSMSISALLGFIVAIPVAYSKVFGRNILVHNISELFIYPGVSVVFVPILNFWTISVLLVLISAYDIYAVWHAGFMQKMAKYQINELKFFTGFFLPYVKKADRVKIQKIKSLSKKAMEKAMKKSRIKVHLAILGGGDVVFPIITSGVVLVMWGLIPALMVAIGATLALSLLFYFSEKGKFYPAMPFISAGIFLGMLVAWLLA